VCCCLNCKSGEMFEYNNTGYVLLALIIERVSRKAFVDYMTETIFTLL
jgi:CubicO group peptidase (beta-lactamase class C family)